MLILVACAAMDAPADPAADRVAIDSLARQEMQALLAGDIEGHLATHASDAVVMPPDMPAARGLEDVRGMLTELHGMFDIDGTFTVGATTVDGDLAYQEMSYELTLTPKAGGETATDVGKGGASRTAAGRSFSTCGTGVRRPRACSATRSGV
jgi:ketosteroid isomerase-like protein